MHERIGTQLLEGGAASIPGFGELTLRHYKAYTGRDPDTGKPVQVPEKRLPFFKVSADLENALGEREPLPSNALGPELAALVEELTRRGRARFGDLGAFALRKKSARTGLTPQTGERLELAARVVVTFKPSTSLIRALNPHLFTGSRAKVNAIEMQESVGRHRAYSFDDDSLETMLSSLGATEPGAEPVKVDALERALGAELPSRLRRLLELASHRWLASLEPPVLSSDESLRAAIDALGAAQRDYGHDVPGLLFAFAPTDDNGADFAVLRRHPESAEWLVVSGAYLDELLEQPARPLDSYLRATLFRADLQRSFAGTELAIPAFDLANDFLSDHGEQLSVDWL